MLNENHSGRAAESALLTPRQKIQFLRFIPVSKVRRTLLTLLALFVFTAAQADPKPPNILFVIMDDVGIDQMSLFGFGGIEPPRMPNIDTIAHAGVQFRNAWAMPACSTSRAVFFTGRYPFRTNVLGALGPDDLANAQVSPYEVTVPVLLKDKGYKSGIFGKYHLGLQGKNPFGVEMASSLGWDYFFGWLDETGDPSSIDRTAGNVAEGEVEYSCGFVPGAHKEGGADFGACYFASEAGFSCEELVIEDGVPPGRACRDSGGILDPSAICKPLPSENIIEGFKNLSAHYVSPLFKTNDDGIIVPVPHTNIEARTYRGTVQVDAAIDWINEQPKHQPWMASVSFSTAHTPVMQPPQELITEDAAGVSNIECDSSMVLEQRALTNLMIEALDTEFARLLVSIGVARLDKNGNLKYNPNNNDTMIVILGDNGTLGTAVKVPPFDPSRAKGTAYQTGVWVPLIVSGPMVKKPDRVVPHMVNIADLYQLFGEIADIDVHASVPRTLDSETMMPYLTNPKQEAIREYNFTQVGPNAQAGGPGIVNGPCTINQGCTQIPVTKTVCNDNGGMWWGEDPDVGDEPQQYCCNVNQYQWEHGKPLFNLQPLNSVAVRNEDFKVVRNSYRGDATPSANGEKPNCDINVTDEFYNINETEPKIDRKFLNLFELQPELTPHQLANYIDLTEQLLHILTSETKCLGDGNIDGMVDMLDEVDWAEFAALSMGNSSWFDFNHDGMTNEIDLAIIVANQGPCDE